MTPERKLRVVHRIVARSILAACMVSGACGTDSESRRVEPATFNVRECKVQEASAVLLTGRDAADFAGLECVTWEFDRQRQVIDVINRREGCGFQGNDEEGRTLWAPAVTQPESSRLDFRIEWKFGSPNACGECLHDFSIALRDVMFEDELTLDFASRSCTSDCNWTRDTLVMPLAEQRAGVACRHIDWSRELSPRETHESTLHMPARDGACDETLVAVEIDDVGEVCLAVCASVEDCPLPDIQSCVDGSCRLSNPWPR